MSLTAARCRAEQARHLKRSLEDPLFNRRKIAAQAADAWNKEALRAEEKESRPDRILSKEDAKIAQQFADEDAADGRAAKTSKQ